MKRHSLDHILECTLRCCNITREEWQKQMHGRKGYIARAKQLLSYIALNEGYEHNDIAQFLEQHRTSVIHNAKVLREEISFYPPLQDLVDKIVHMLGPLPQEHQKQKITYGWLARSSTGLLTFSPHAPERLGGYWMAEGSKPFQSDQFPQITYETGPVKVKIKITLENETM